MSVSPTAPARGAVATAPVEDALLSAIAVTKAFGGLVAVDDVSFAIPRHAIVSIIGPNGAGKTTFFNMLTGLYRPTIGQISFDGRDITRRRPDRITKLGIARTFQNIRLFASMTALETSKSVSMRGCTPGSSARSASAVVAVRSAARARRRARRSPTSAYRPRRTTSSRSTCHTAISAAWRSRVRSRRILHCCC